MVAGGNWPLCCDLRTTGQEQAERDAARERTQADIIAAEQMLQQLARTRSSQDNQVHQGQQAVQDKIGALQEARQQLADQRRSFQVERVLRQDRAQAARDNEKYIQSNQQKERRIWMRTVLEESRTRLSLARGGRRGHATRAIRALAPVVRCTILHIGSMAYSSTLNNDKSNGKRRVTA